MKVSDIMTGDVRACRPENNLAEAARVMWERDCGSVPVVDTSNRVVGMVTDRDICMAVATQNRLASEIRAGEIGLRQVITCSPEADVAAALALMQREQVRRLPVVDAQGALVGILSLHDVTLSAKKGESKKGKHVAHKDVMTTLKAINEPHRTADEKTSAGDDSYPTDGA